MIRALVVPVDGVEANEHVIPLVEALARRNGAAVHLLFVGEARVPEPYLEGLTPYQFEGVEDADERWRREMRARDEAYLARLAGRLSAEGTSVSSTVLSPSTATGVHRFADACDADLIMVSVHGATGSGWLDEVGAALIRHARMPLLMVPPRQAPTDGRFRRVLIPLDGSGFAEQVIGRAQQLDPERLAEYILVKVLPVPRRGATYASYGLHVADQDLLHRQGVTREYLQRVSDTLRAQGYKASVRVLVHPSAPDAILNAAQDHGADLIAMATHGRGGLSKLLLGSVAEEVLRATVQPLLLFRPRGDTPAF
jgi:nucleotide-binding universal stress UspA family protein